MNLPNSTCCSAEGCQQQQQQQPLLSCGKTHNDLDKSLTLTPQTAEVWEHQHQHQFEDQEHEPLCFSQTLGESWIGASTSGYTIPSHLTPFVLNSNTHFDNHQLIFKDNLSSESDYDDDDDDGEDDHTNGLLDAEMDAKMAARPKYSHYSSHNNRCPPAFPNKRCEYLVQHPHRDFHSSARALRNDSDSMVVDTNPLSSQNAQLVLTIHELLNEKMTWLTQRGKLEAEAKVLRDELSLKSNQEQHHFAGTLNQLQAQLVQKDGIINELESKQSHLIVSNEQIIASNKKLAGQMDAIMQDHLLVVSELQSKLATSEGAITQLTRQNKILSDQITVITNANTLLEKDLSGTVESNRILRDNNTGMLSENVTKSDQIAQLNTDNQSIRTNLEQTDQRVKALMAEKGALVDTQHRFNALYNTWTHSSLIKQTFLRNQLRWDGLKKQFELDFNGAVQDYDQKKARGDQDSGDLGERPKEMPVTAEVVWTLVPNNPTKPIKNIHLSYSTSLSRQPILADLYKIPTSTNRPIIGHFLKKDCEIGIIPPLTDNLKLFFSSKHVDGGRWVQFHGPGKEVDGSSWESMITLFALMDPHDPGSFNSTHDRDRCELSHNECQQSHKTTDANYSFYHSSPTTRYEGHYQILVKWEP